MKLSLTSACSLPPTQPQPHPTPPVIDDCDATESEEPVGEVLLRGPQLPVSSGYHKMPENKESKGAGKTGERGRRGRCKLFEGSRLRRQQLSSVAT